jgi:hypothetical protein
VSIDHGQESFRREPIADYDEPVARYLTHAIADGATVGTATRLTMTGQIKVGMWLPFRATERCGARSFEWRARVGWGNTRILDVLDSYASGRGRTSGRLLGRLRIDGHGAVKNAVADRWGSSGKKGVRLHPVRVRGPRRTAVRQARGSEPRHRRLVVRHPALRPRLQGRDDDLSPAS